MSENSNCDLAPRRFSDESDVLHFCLLDGFERCKHVTILCPGIGENIDPVFSAIAQPFADQAWQLTRPNSKIPEVKLSAPCYGDSQCVLSPRTRHQN